MATAMLLFTSCSKDTAAPKLNFTNNVAEGQANNQGEFTITGHISSTARLDKVTLTKSGETTAFFVDEATAKNKNEYDFSYLVTGITTNTTIVIKTYDQESNTISTNFLIKK